MINLSESDGVGRCDDRLICKLIHEQYMLMV